MAHQHDHNCAHNFGSLTATLDEMQFDRSLNKAALDGDIDRVKHFLTRGTDPNDHDSYGYTPLHFAARYGHLEIVKLLKGSGASTNLKTNGGVTAAHRAALMGHSEVLWEIVDDCWDEVDDDGDTIAHKAARGGFSELAKEIIGRYPTLDGVKNRKDLLWIDLLH